VILYKSCLEKDEPLYNISRVVMLKPWTRYLLG
jgi:hypothetical protein